jgi:hypothetical protein
MFPPGRGCGTRAQHDLWHRESQHIGMCNAAALINNEGKIMNRRLLIQVSDTDGV